MSKLRKWKIEVEGRDGFPSEYTILAIEELDARLLACALNGDFHGEWEMIMNDVRWVKNNTRILEVSDA